MKKIIASIIVIGLLLSTASMSMSREEAVNGEQSDAGEPIPYIPSDDPLHVPDFIPGEFIIKFREDVDICLSLSADGALVTGIASIDALNKEYKVDSAEEIFKNKDVSSLSNVYKFTLDNADIPMVVEEYSSDPCVVYAEPNYIYTIQKAQARSQGVFPNDPEFSEQWALHNTGQTGGTFDADIDAPEAWDIETGDPNVVIAVIDTGVDYNHEDLAGNIWINHMEDINGNGQFDNYPVEEGGDLDGIDNDNNDFVDDVIGWNFVINDSDPLDDHGHGTHCSGIASAMTNNDIGIAGVCWNCKIMPLKFGFTIEEAAAALVYAADNGADVVSMSWGSYAYSQLLHDALEYAYSKGVFLVASAGNDNTDLKHYPSGYDTVISVAATDSNDARAGFSNYGQYVDVAAPGVSILSTLPNENYGKYSGTSMAGPHVAGLAGLLLSKNPGPCPAGMAKTMILHTADEIDTDEYIGSGRINAYKALVRDPAIASLHINPSWKDNAKGTVDIEGCAWGESFQSFILEYGRGKNPDTWIEMTSSIVPEYGVLFSWDTTQVDEGLYTIRLTVICSDGVYIDKTGIVVNNVYNVIHVDADNTGGPWDGTPVHPYQYLRDGVDDQGKDDRVYVHEGTYYIERMSIEKTINLTGEDRDTTIIDGCGSDFIFILYSSWNNITGFTITDSSIGIYLWTSDCNTFSGNIITDNDYAGICLVMSSDNNVSGNTITNNKYGIRLYYSCYNNIISGNTITLNYEGIVQRESAYNSIVENTIEDNDCGIYFLHSDYNDIHGNEIKENEYGIFLSSIWLFKPTPWWSTNNTIYENNITDNDIGIEIHLDVCGGDSPYDNTIYHNNFINNRKNARDESFNKNHWDNGYSDPFDPQTDGGNYWDDYIGPDILPPYGIGDIPYNIPPRLSYNEDRYPLMKPYDGQSSPSSSQSQSSSSQQSTCRSSSQPSSQPSSTSSTTSSSAPTSR